MTQERLLQGSDQAICRVKHLLESISTTPEAKLVDDTEGYDVHDYLQRFQTGVDRLPERLARRAKQTGPGLKKNVTLFVKGLQTATKQFEKRMHSQKQCISTGDLIALAKGIEDAMREFMMKELADTRPARLQLQAAQNAYHQTQEHAVSLTSEKTNGGFLQIDEDSVVRDICDIFWEKVHSWVMNTDDRKPRILWLNGEEALSKSAISSHIERMAYKQTDFLFANFIFCRDGIRSERLTDAKLALPTLMGQIAFYDKKFANQFKKILSRTPDVVVSDFKTQFEQLIQIPFERSRTSSWFPWSGSKEAAPVLIAIDGLDECDSEAAIQDLLGVLLSGARSMRGNLVFFIDSRPETYIQSIFEKHDKEEFKYETSNLADVHAAFLRQRIIEMTKAIEVALPQEWPREEDVALLVNNYGCVGAVTALRFICDKHVRDPEGQLQVLLALTDDPEANNQADSNQTADKLYLGILQDIIKRNPGENFIERIHQALVALVLLREPDSSDYRSVNFTTSDFSKFLDLEEDEFFKILYHLKSVVTIPNTGKEDSPRFLHSSFREFVTDPRRCSDARFLVDAKAEELGVLLRCFEMMKSSLRPHMIDTTGIEKPAEFTTYEIRFDFPKRIEQVFTPVLGYVVESWPKLLEAASPDDIPTVEPLLREFVETNLLCWFESMSWMGPLPSGLASIQGVIDWMAKHNLNSEVRNKLIDAHQVVERNLKRICLNALSIYELLPGPSTETNIITSDDQHNDTLNGFTSS